MAVFAAVQARPDEMGTGSSRGRAKALRRLLIAASLVGPAIGLGACQDSGMLGGVSARSIAPIPAKTLALMQTKGMSQSDPILIRAYKKEAEMEVWKRTGPNGQYALLKTFPICRWSGQLGPKTKQGDRQAPEGFYTVAPGQMNPNSSYYLSFDVGYPNAVDRAKGGTGNYIMVHGTCSSAGCFAMTDASMGEVYAIAREAFAGGQRGFQFQSYPFRMTPANMARFRNDPNAPFWKNLKEGSDYFEALKDEPRVAACGTKYVFGGSDVAAGSCTPRLDPLVAEKRVHDEKQTAEFVAKGERATRVVYEDGGQNPVFRPQPPQTMNTFAALTDKDKDKDEPYSAAVYGRHALGDVSRPESLAAGPQEIEIDAKGRPVLVAKAPADAPGPTKAAAAALGRKGKSGKDEAKPATLVAAQEAQPERKEAPARIAVADAEGDPGAYHKLLGNLFNKPAAAAPPAAEPAPSAAPAPAKTEPAAESRKAGAKREAKAEPVRTGALKAESEKPSARMAARHAAKAAEEKPAHKSAPKPQASAEPAPGAKGEAPRGRN